MAHRGPFCAAVPGFPLITGCTQKRWRDTAACGLAFLPPRVDRQLPARQVAVPPARLWRREPPARGRLRPLREPRVELRSVAARAADLAEAPTALHGQGRALSLPALADPEGGGRVQGP